MDSNLSTPTNWSFMRSAYAQDYDDNTTQYSSFTTRPLPPIGQLLNAPLQLEQQPRWSSSTNTDAIRPNDTHMSTATVEKQPQPAEVHVVEPAQFQPSLCGMGQPQGLPQVSHHVPPFENREQQLELLGLPNLMIADNVQLPRLRSPQVVVKDRNIVHGGFSSHYYSDLAINEHAQSSASYNAANGATHMPIVGGNVAIAAQMGPNSIAGNRRLAAEDCYDVFNAGQAANFASADPQQHAGQASPHREGFVHRGRRDSPLPLPHCYRQSYWLKEGRRAIRWEKSQRPRKRAGKNKPPASSKVASSRKPGNTGKSSIRKSKGICSICKKRTAEFRPYGGVSCDACRLFFRANYYKELFCKCTIKGSSTEPSCRFCRMKRCREAGMNYENRRFKLVVKQKRKQKREQQAIGQLIYEALTPWDERNTTTTATNHSTAAVSVPNLSRGTEQIYGREIEPHVHHPAPNKSAVPLQMNNFLFAHHGPHTSRASNDREAAFTTVLPGQQQQFTANSLLCDVAEQSRNYWSNGGQMTGPHSTTYSTYVRPHLPPSVVHPNIYPLNNGYSNGRVVAAGGNIQPQVPISTGTSPQQLGIGVFNSHVLSQVSPYWPRQYQHGEGLNNAPSNNGITNGSAFTSSNSGHCVPHEMGSRRGGGETSRLLHVQKSQFTIPFHHSTELLHWLNTSVTYFTYSLQSAPSCTFHIGPTAETDQPHCVSLSVSTYWLNYLNEPMLVGGKWLISEEKELYLTDRANWYWYNMPTYKLVYVGKLIGAISFLLLDNGKTFLIVHQYFENQLHMKPEFLNRFFRMLFNTHPEVMRIHVVIRNENTTMQAAYEQIYGFKRDPSVMDRLPDPSIYAKDRNECCFFTFTFTS